MTDHPLTEAYIKEVVQSDPVAHWDLIGNGSVVIYFDERRRIPNRWVRFWTKVFLNSKWQLPEDNSGTAGALQALARTRKENKKAMERLTGN